MARERIRRSKRPDIVADAPTSRGIAFLEDEENAYAEALEERHGMDSRAQKLLVIAVVLIVVFLVGLVVPKNLLNEGLQQGGYNVGYTLSWFVRDLQANVNGLIGALTGHDDATVPFSDTMIRYLMVALTGAGMALSGAVYQGSFRNALVSPSTLGVMSGASLGLLVWVALFVNDDGSNVSWLSDGAAQATGTLEYLWSSYGVAVCSFIGCGVVVALVLATVRLAGNGSASPILMIITGQIIGAVMGAIGNAIRYYYVTMDPYGAKASLLTELQISTFYRDFTLIDVLAVGIPIVVVFAVVMRLRRRMTLLSFSAAEARTMGVDARRMQAVVVTLCTLLTAIIVSFCGSVGFVGFLVPHLARRLVGPNFSYLLPAATVLGAVFVLAAYILLLVTFGSSFETMVGMYISIGGAAVFLVTALRGKGGARGEFR